MNAHQAFWTWFQLHEDELFVADHTSEALFDLLAEELHKIHPDLTFEFGPTVDGVREFVISAGGLKKAFPAVKQLAAAAPNLPKWKVMSFRPRKSMNVLLEIGGRRIEAKDLSFTILRDKEELGLNLFIPGYTKEDHGLTTVGYLMLDCALGEYDVETKVGLIKMFAPETETKGQRYPLPELPTLFDEAYTRLRSGG